MSSRSLLNSCHGPGGDLALQFSASSVEMLRFCSQALSFSSTFYVAPFVQSWHWNTHTIIRYSYEIRKMFMSLSALSKYFFTFTTSSDFQSCPMTRSVWKRRRLRPRHRRRSFPQASLASFLSRLLAAVTHLQADRLVLWSWVLITTLTPHRQGCKTDLGLLWKTVWQVLKKLTTELPCDLAVPLLCTYVRAENMSIWRLVQECS